MNNTPGEKCLHIAPSARREDDTEWGALAKLIKEVQQMYMYETQHELPQDLVDCVILDNKKANTHDMGLVGCLVGIVKSTDATMWKIVTHTGTILMDSMYDPARFQVVKVYSPTLSW